MRRALSPSTRPELTLQDFSRCVTNQIDSPWQCRSASSRERLGNSGCGGLRIANARGVPFEIRLAESPNNHSVTGRSDTFPLQLVRDSSLLRKSGWGIGMEPDENGG